MLARMIALFSLLLIAACGRGHENTAQLAALASEIGTLSVDPSADSRITAGTVQYRVYENGLVYYSGDISYKVAGNFSVTVPFSGKTTMTMASVQSASYQAGAKWVERKVALNVAKIDAGVANVNVSIADKSKVDSTDMTGSLVVRTTAALVTIQTVDVQGTIFEGTPAKTTIHLRLTAD